MEAATIRVALCEMDARLLSEIYPGQAYPSVLSPPLREDIKTQATSSAMEVASSGERRYLTCCSRLTPEKNVHQFVALCVLMKEELHKQGIVPYLVGSRIPGEYADKAVSDLKAAFPGESSIVRDFMPAEELGVIFSQSLLLVLPSLYDSWGMVVTEAAVFGTPTVLHSSGIGVADLLKPPTMSIAVDFSQEDVTAAAETTLKTLQDREELERSGLRAKAASLGWDETAFAGELANLMAKAVGFKEQITAAAALSSSA